MEMIRPVQQQVTWTDNGVPQHPVMQALKETEAERCSQMPAELSSALMQNPATVALCMYQDLCSSRVLEGLGIGQAKSCWGKLLLLMSLRLPHHCHSLVAPPGPVVLCLISQQCQLL